MPSHQRRRRYSAAGKRSTKNVATPRQVPTRAPTARLRARASSDERCAISEASGAAVRTTDRWVATCWYRSTSSSLSAPVSRPPPGQLLEALPLPGVREHVGVEVHARHPMLGPCPSRSSRRSPADDLVTGEAVALDLPPASLGPRIVSGLVDVLLDAGC